MDRDKARRVAASLNADDLAWLTEAVTFADEQGYNLRDFILNNLERPWDRFGANDRSRADRIRHAVKVLGEDELRCVCDHAERLFGE